MFSFKKFFSGQYGLAKTYWFGIFTVALVFYGINVITLKAYLSAAPDSEQFLWNVHLGMALLGLFIIIFSALSVINAASYQRKRGFWGWVATIIAVATIIRATMAIIVSVTGVYSSLSQLQDELRTMNAALPTRLSDTVTLKRVTLNENEAILTYHLTEDVAYSGYDEAEASQLIKSNLLTADGGLCEELTFLSQGLVEAVVYEYTGNDSVVISASIYQSDCQ